MAFSLKGNKIFPWPTNRTAAGLAGPETNFFVVLSREPISSNTGIASTITLTYLLLMQEGLE